MDFLAELKKLLDSLPQGDVAKVIENSYKAHGFDPAKPPTDYELALWATELIYKWYYEPKSDMNLPLAGLCLAYNMVTFNKLNQFDQTNLKTLLSAVYNMGWNMGAYKLRSPFDKKPQPQDLN